MKKLIFLFVPLIIIFSACSKSSGNDNENFGTKPGTWTFTEGAHTFSGGFFAPFDSATLNTTLQSNNTYTFGMLGLEKDSGFGFNMTFSLLDLDFATKSYQSGIAGDDHLNAFYFMPTFVSLENIYKSSNLDPGPVMNYTITAYDATKAMLTMEFSGQAQLDDGTYVGITKGKLTIPVTRY